MDKIDRDDENKTQRLYRCCSNYALSKLIVDNGLEDLWRRENPDSPGSSATIGPLPKINIDCLYWSLAKDLSKQMYSGESGFSLLHTSCPYWYKNLLKIPRLITKWYPLLTIIMLFLMTDSPQKLKSENVLDTLIILLYVSPRSAQLQRHLFFY